MQRGNPVFNDPPFDNLYRKFLQQQAESREFLEMLQQIIDPNRRARTSYGPCGGPCCSIPSLNRLLFGPQYSMGSQGHRDLPFPGPNLPFSGPNLPFPGPNLPFPGPNLPFSGPNLPFPGLNLPFPGPNLPFSAPNCFGCPGQNGPGLLPPISCYEGCSFTDFLNPPTNGRARFSRPCPLQQQMGFGLSVPPYDAPFPGFAAPVAQQMGRQPREPSMMRPQQAEEYEDEEYDEEGFMEDEEESGSDDEIVCDIDAIMAMRAARDVSDRVSEESFELVDSVDNERIQYEHLEMDEFGNMQSRPGKRGEVNTRMDELKKKEERQFLYGDKADAISGLETLMAINFDHFIDTHHPVLWPVLPL